MNYEYMSPVVTGVELPAHLCASDHLTLIFGGKEYTRIATTNITLKTAEEMFEFVGISEFERKMMAAASHDL